MLNSEFFKPVSDAANELVSSGLPDALAAVTTAYSLKNGFPATDNARIAIIGVPDYRGSATGKDFHQKNDAIREKLYQLKKHEKSVGIIDFGDLVFGNTIEDTYFALTEITEELLKRSVIPIIIGGSQDLSVAQFNAYKQFNKLVNIAGIDARFDLGLPEQPFSNESWLGKIIMQQPNFLFNFSNIAYQTYFVGASAVQLMNNLYFDAYRVGDVRSDITEIEPIIRTADMISFDISSIKQADAPGSSSPSPNGLTGEEACQAMMYAGLNDRLTSLGIYEFDAFTDRNDQTAHLIAQMIWYFIEGVNNRKNDFPKENDLKGFIKYNVAVDHSGNELVFLKHQTSSRWWIEIPELILGDKLHNLPYRYLPCSYRDYQQACNNELPDRYWQAIQKL